MIYVNFNIHFEQSVFNNSSTQASWSTRQRAGEFLLGVSLARRDYLVCMDNLQAVLLLLDEVANLVKR